MDNPIKSFWIGGYECTDKLNAFGHRVDFLRETRHDSLVTADYELLHPLRIQTVREGVRWSNVESSPGKYDWSLFTAMVLAGKSQGIQQVWDLCHFGYPDDLTPMHPLFARRFTAFAREFVIQYRRLEPKGPLIVTPINEIGFISWLGGEVAGTVPYCRGIGWQVKYQLAKAFIEAVRAMKELDPDIIILSTEPLTNIIPPAGADQPETELAIRTNEEQYQVMDILCGMICPELGGHPGIIDIAGYNYYYNNQWVRHPYQVLDWQNPVSAGGKTLSALLTETWVRYNKPFVIAETSHPGEDRPAWIEMLSTEVITLLSDKLPLWAVCWYPVIDRPDWDHLEPWHHAGLWDNDSSGAASRVIHEPTISAFRLMQYSVDAVLGRRTGSGSVLAV